LIALYNLLLFKPSSLNDLLGETFIDWDIAAGFNNITPKSGNTNPYEPEFGTYPLFGSEPAVPFEPEISWSTLDDPKNVFTETSFELSVNCIILFPEPDNVRFKVPGNKDSLYLALSKLITQKFEAVITLFPTPKIKLAFFLNGTSLK
jgi:hypothetical protein